MQGYLPGLFSMLQGGAQTPWQQLQASRQQQNTGLLGLLGRQETSPGLYHGMGQGSLYYQPWMNRDNWPAAPAQTPPPAVPTQEPASLAASASASAPYHRFRWPSATLYRRYPQTYSMNGEAEWRAAGIDPRLVPQQW